MKQPTKDELYAAADEAYDLGYEAGYWRGQVDAARHTENTGPADDEVKASMWDRILGRSK